MTMKGNNDKENDNIKQVKNYLYGNKGRCTPRLVAVQYVVSVSACRTCQKEYHSEDSGFVLCL